jgi:hypothetical protein
MISPERVLDDLVSIREPGVFIVDDVAFIHAEHGLAIGEATARTSMTCVPGPRSRLKFERTAFLDLLNQTARLWNCYCSASLFPGS